jgi:hypothetical protein
VIHFSTRGPAGICDPQAAIGRARSGRLLSLVPQRLMLATNKHRYQAGILGGVTVGSRSSSS